MRRVLAVLAAAALAACGGGGDGGGKPAPSTPPPKASDPSPGIPGATNHTIESISVHTLAWLSDAEVVTVEFPDAGSGQRPAWVVVAAKSGAVRRVTPPPPADCPDAAATGPARIRDHVVAYVEHCPGVNRSRILTYDFRTGRTAPLAEAPGVELEHVTLDRAGRPVFAGNVSSACSGLTRVTGGGVDATFPVPGDPPWDLAAPLRGGDCAATGRAALARLDRAGQRVAFLGARPGAQPHVHVTRLAPFDPRPVGPALPSPVDVEWSRDGKSLYVTSRAAPFVGLARLDVATGKVTVMYAKSVLSVALSPDGKRLAVLRPRPDTTTLALLPV